jgi:hypothetical protein
MFEVRVEVAGGEEGGGVSCGYFHPFVVSRRFRRLRHSSRAEGNFIFRALNMRVRWRTVRLVERRAGILQS